MIEMPILVIYSRLSKKICCVFVSIRKTIYSAKYKKIKRKDMYINNKPKKSENASCFDVWFKLDYIKDSYLYELQWLSN